MTKIVSADTIVTQIDSKTTEPTQVTFGEESITFRDRTPLRTGRKWFDQFY